jgi:hypothetical protein
LTRCHDFKNKGKDMSAWKNKHIVIATLMAPVLALVAYFGIGAILGEDPIPAEAGQSYQLLEKPNCRYASGLCGLKNGDFELDLSFEMLDIERMLLKLESVHPLDGVLVALVEDETEEQTPVEMRPVGSDGLTWSLEVGRPDAERHRLHLVASSDQVLYFGDVATKFTLNEDTSN